MRSYVVNGFNKTEVYFSSPKISYTYMQSRIDLIVSRLSFLVSNVDSQVLWFQDSCCSPNFMFLFQVGKGEKIENTQETYLIYATSCCYSWVQGHWEMQFWAGHIAVWNEMCFLLVKKRIELGRQPAIFAVNILWGNHSHILLFIVCSIKNLLHKILTNYIQIFKMFTHFSHSVSTFGKWF